MSTLFGDDDAGPVASALQRSVIAAYVAVGRTLDDLPYTREWDEVMLQVRQSAEVQGQRGEKRGEKSGEKSSETSGEREVFHLLQTIRKRGELPRVGRGGATPVRVTVEDEVLMGELLVERAGTMGKRDQLPFTPQFDELAQAFNQRSGRGLSPYEVWRLVAKLAK